MGGRINKVNSQVKALVCAVVASVLMGTLGMFVKESQCAAQTCSFVRFAIGLLLVLPLFLLRPGSKAFSWQSVVSGIGISLCILFYFYAICGLSVGVAALLLYTGPVFAAAGEAVIRRRMPGARDFLLMLASLAGIALVCGPGVGAGGQALDVVYGILSGVCYAAYILFNRLIPGNVTMLQRTFWQFAAGVAVLAGPFLMQESPLEHVDTGWPHLLCIGVLQGFLVLLLVAYAVKHLSAIRYGTIAYVEPVLAVALGWLVYQDTMSPLQWLGVVLVLAASAAQSLLPQNGQKTSSSPQHD